MQRATRRIMTCVVLIILGAIFLIDVAPSWAQPPNPVVTENALAGNPASEWDVIGEGDPTLQGFTTDISYNVGQTVEFKITAPGPYALYIYRMGYYNGAGARLVATIPSGSTSSPAQPACITDPVTGLYDCGNWSVTATWPIPANAVSGVYFAKALPDGQALNINNGSHIAWIVRDDARQADILFQTQDTTWQAYNRYGTGSLYAWQGPGVSPGLNPDRAHKVSYNRPITTREYAPEDWVFNSEYPMIRWLERNGYDVTYISGVDAHRYPAELLDPTILLFIGHDEYWSQAQRDNVEAALAAGKHLAFFTGNEIFWRIRYENSIDGNNTPLRTMVGYKDSHNDEIWPDGIDPVDYTGTWRDPRISDWTPDPENRLVGQIFTVNCCSYPIQVPSEFSNLRFWRNTSIATLAPGTQATLTQSTLGYEWDEALDNDDRPAGLFKMSSTTQIVDQKLLDYSSDFGPEIATHNLTMYKAPSGALVFGAGTIQWSWGLDGNHDRGNTFESVDMQQATVNLLADMGNVQPETLQVGLVAATQSTDATAPTSTITSPSNGATVQMPVTITGTAADTGGGVVAGVEISTDNGATWRWATGTTNWTYVFSPPITGLYSLRTRAVDDSGNLEVPSTTVTITVEEGDCPCSLWDDSFVPTNPNVDDGSGLEVGVRFKAAENGFVTALRFYKGVQNTGTHVGSLWTEGGTLLSQVTFTNETASGWQTMYLPSPVAVTANTTYVASYHAPTGVHAETINYFSGGDWTRGPLTAFGAANGGNGVYAYSASPIFPTSVGGSYWNYWVDVLFVTEVVPDTTPPTVTSVIPNSGAVGVSVGSNVSATFSEPMIGATINGTSFELRDSLNNLIPAVVTYDVGGQTATLNPSAALQYNMTYTATVTTAVTDLAGLPLGANEVWSFTTEVSPPPPPDEGPGGPILVVSSALNPFGRYYAEILRAEGLNAFYVTDITLVDSTVLSSYDVVILGEMALDSTQASMFATWVNNGGNLIAMRPDPDLAGLLGLTSVGTTLTDAWLLVDTTVGTPGEGIVNETIQFHGTADRWTLSGASALAWLYNTSAAATANPAVTMRSVGLNGGQAAAFTYDLAKSVVYTRQGNPALAGVNTDLPITGNNTLRANDMFYPDWIDLNKAQIPTADEQQRLLANMILDMNADKKPLPRFWYLPRGERIVLLMTGDDHSSISGTLNFFNYYRGQGSPGCSVDDWECIRATAYIYIDSGLTPAEAFQAEQDGFEVSIHPFGTACTNWDPAIAATAIANEISAWQAKYALNRSPVSNRNHCVTWTDFSTMAEASLANGIRLDTNYYYWPGAWLLDRPGYFNGSGLPMRFAQEDGQLIDVYQATTQLTDESLQTLGTHFQTLINNANDPAKGYIGVITANMHTDGALSYGANTLVPLALGNSVPVVSAYQMLTWLDGRNGSEFNNINWAGDQLTFDIDQANGARGLRAMLPAQGIAGPLVNLTRNGLLVPYTYETFKGVQYVTFDAEDGAYVADYSVDSTGPVISNVVATVAPNNDVTITWTTNELSDSTVLFGTDAGALTSSESNPLNTTAHSVTLFGLPLNTTFYYRVVSTDLSANPSTFPVPPAAPLNFTTNMSSVGDTTTADFSNGTGGCTVWTIGDGAVILPPTAASEFNGTALPAGWVERSAPWNTGGFATVGSGVLSVDGQRVSTGSPYTANLTLEFVATFTSQAFQNGGFGGSNLIAGDPSEVYNNGPWAMFSTQNGGGLSARLNTPGGNADYAIPNGATYLGSPHLYRVEWTTTGFNFYIDGVLIHTSALTVPTPMYPAFSDFYTITPLNIDWARVTPYGSPCTYSSRVFGSSTPSDWAEIVWTSTEPAGTAITMRVRTGETVVPDGSWTAWQPVTNGANVGVNSRYIQYEATLSTTDPFVTPELELVSIQYNAGPDITPPSIISRSPVQSATSVPVGTSVVVGFDELLNPATVTGAFTLRAQGAPSDVPATVTYNSVLASVTIDPNADLAFATTYTVTVAATVADLAGNPLGAPDTWTFATEDAPPVSLTDTTVVDFGAGSGDCVVWPSGDGAVSLAASLSDEFNGVALDPVWTVSNWQGLFNTPSATVSGGSVAVNDVLLATSTFYEAGHVFEARATFGPDTFQHVGFAYNLTSIGGQSWAMFSTGNSTNTVYTRVNQNGSTVEVAIPGSSAYIGTPHVYRIEWLANLVTFYVDGVQVYQLAVTLPGTDPTTSMRPMFSDYNDSAGEATVDLVIDWMRMSPYTSPCTFTSRVFDGGGAGTWGLMSWQSTEPAGTAIAMEIRTGDTATPDGSWSGWTAISNNASIGASARYAQYRATLSTSDPIYSPELQLVELAFSAGSNTAPVATDDAYATDEDVELVVNALTGVLANDTDAESDPMTAVLVTDVTNGTLTLNSDGSFTYTPDANFNGEDTFTYKANDGAIDSANATVTITVNPINDAPVAVDDAYSTDEDTPLTVEAATGVLANDTDVDLDTLEVTVVTDVTNGTLALATDGSFTYTPNADFNGVDTFTYIVNDGTVDSTEATVTITVEPVNDAPVAVDDTYATEEDAELVVDALTGVLANDTDAELDSLTAELVTDVTNGTLLLAADGSFTYTPNTGFNGSDSFTYNANDSLLDSNIATVTINVGAVNDPPVAVDDAYSTDEDTPLTVAAPGVLGNDTDVETDPLTAVLDAGPTNGGLTLNPDGSFTYTPNANFNGSDSFTYLANDGTANSAAPATVTITVNPVNDAPVAVNDNYSTDEDTPLTVAVPGVLGNDTDVETNPLTAALVTDVTNGTLTLNSDGSFTYTPNANFNGSDSFTYNANDSLLDSNIATVTINVGAVNDPPVAVDDAYSTDEDTPLTVAAPGVLGNDTDAETDPLTAVLDAGPTNGGLTLNPDGSFTYTPNANFNGSDSFTYRANDGAANSVAPATVTITVNPVNDAPVAVSDAYSTNEDVALVVNVATGVLANDTDVDGNPLTAVLDAGPTNGGLTLNPDGSFTYTPNANFNGSDSFTYKANDGTADSNIATVTITVNPVNDAPVAVSDAYSTDEDVALNVPAPGVLGNDTDVDGNPLTAIKVTDPSNGAVTLSSDGSFTYTPNAGFNGFDSFTYNANDSLLDSNVVTVTINVGAVNDPPVAVDDSYATNEDVALVVNVATGVLANDTDVDGNPLTAVLVTGPASGSLLLDPNGSFTYTPAANFNGSVNFTYRANDGTANSNIATVTITVNPVNDAPVAVSDAYSTDEDVALVVNVATGVLGNDTDVDGNPLNAIKVTDPSSGTVTVNADGAFTYTPNANFNGSDSFTYRANDGTADSNIATVTITVNPINDAPVAVSDAYSTNEDVALNVPAPGVLGNDTDVDGNPLNAIKVTDPSNGTVSLNASGAFTYTPNANFNGSDSFTYRANDGTTDSNVVTVSITVNPVNDAPVAVNDSYSTNEDVALNVPAPGVLGNDTDVDGNPLNAIKVTDPSNGTVSLNASGAFTYTPNANFNGSDSFTYKANDGTTDSNVVTVSITVNPVNDAPVAADNGYDVNEDAVLTITAPGILANDNDVEGSALTAQLVATTTNGTLNLSANGGFTYTPNANFNGSDSFTYRANDGTADSNIATVTITVNPVNDAPVAVNDSYSTNEDVALVVNVATGVLGNDNDVDLDALSAVLEVGPTNGVLNLNADGSFTYTPNASFNGSDGFTYKANDGTADSNVATVTITINPVNDAPVAVDDSYSTDEDVALNVPAAGVLTNDSDADGNPLNALLAVGPTNGVLTLNANGGFTYTPNANFNGSDSFTYRANDGTADSNIATVMITVNAVNDAPVAADNGYDVNEDAVLTITAPGILANDNDVEGSALTAQLVATTTNGTLSLSANGGFTYTPNTNFNGSDSFTYRANDGTVDSNVATVNITVNPVNDAPVALDNGYNVNEDSLLSVDAPGILANDTDVDGNPLTALLVTDVTNGSLTLDSDGSFTYTPNANFNGSDSFTYRANDGAADSNVATVTITVNPVNDAPIAVGDAYATDEDVALNVPAAGVLTNDSDVDGNPLTAVLVTGPASGSLLLDPNGSFTYTPAANFNGSVNFTYRANDGTANSNIATVTITVNPVNDAPAAVNDSYVTDEDMALNVAAPGVLDNDTDIDANPLTAVLVADPTSGTVTVNADGSFIYTPNANFNGSDSFTYRANDGTADSNIATVTITVNAVNDAPVAVDNSYSTDEDVALNVAAPGVLDNDTDVEGSLLTAAVIDTPNNGGLTLNGDGSFTYTPNANFNGVDSFTYVASDGVADSNVATVTITVDPVNDAPIAVNDGYSTDEDVALIVPATGVLGNDTDVDLDPLTAVLVSGTSNGTLVLNPNGSFTYTPNIDFLGVDSFTYRANDGTVTSNLATVTISIGGVNDAPVAVNDSYATDEDVQLTVAAPGVLGNDSDVDLDPLAAQVVDTPDHGSLTLNPNGSFTYTPNANYNGPDSFTYVASDGLLTSNVATVSITVNAVNDAPVAQNNGYNVNEDAVLTITAPGILANDNDVEGSALTAQLVATTSNGTLSLNANGGFTYTPNANYNGPDSFTYRASDGTLLSNIATVTITVNPVNDAPVAVNDSYATDEDTQLTIVAPGVLGNDSDIDGNPLTAIVATTTAHGTLNLNANGSFTYTPDANYNGPDSFTYRANDGSANSPLATVSITVNPVNDPPVAVNDSYTTNEDTPLTVPAAGVLTNDSDVDGNPLTAIKVSDPANGSVTVNSNGSFTYTPNANFNGSDSFSYRATDGVLQSNIATVTITVDPVNDAPVAVNNSYSTNEDTALNLSAPGVLGNDTDVDGNPLTAIKVSDPAHGTLTLNSNGSFTYTPNANYNGPDSFTYRANDGVLNSNVATVNITVTAVNDPPVAVNNSHSTDEDTALNVAAPGVLGNDSDIEGSTLTAVLVAGPAHGTLTLNTNGSFTYTPAANYNGPDSFTYRASDGTLQSNIATVSITVNPINDAPVAVDDSYSMTEDTTLIEPNPGVLTNDSDVDGNPLTVQMVSPPSFGSLTLTITGGFTYTPLPDFTGSDSFTYRATDGTLQSNVATVFISVGNATEIPDANNDSYSTNEDTALNVSAPGVLDNDIEGDGLPLTAILVSGPAHGGLTLNPNGSFTYTPTANYNGPDSFTYRADNGTFTSNIATVSITVNPVNDAPTASADAYATDEDTPLIVAAPGVLDNDSDVEGSALSAVVVANPVHGLLTLNASGGFTYTPNANFNGSDSFTYRASDGALQSNVATVSITVNPANDAPVAVDDSYTASEDTALVIAAPGVLVNDNDVDGNPLTAVLDSGPVNGSLTLNPDGSFTYTPNTDYLGPDSFTYHANDGTVDSNVATVSITVSPVSPPEFYVLNNGFEIPGLTLTKAANWDATASSNAKRKCDKDKDGDGTYDKVFSNSGECALQLRGQAALQSKASQGFAFINFNLGDTVEMSAFVRASSLAGDGQIVLVIDHVEGTKDKLKIFVPTGTYDYALQTVSLVTTGTPIDMKIQIKLGTGSGKYWVDDINLTGFDTSARSTTLPVPDVLPVPDAAAPGWRG